MPVRAVLFDFGGVIVDGPFEGFARYESEAGLPDGLVRRLNATNPDTNAWARLERSEIGLAEFFDLFEAEAQACGHRVDARELMTRMGGQVRPAMVTALRRCREHIKTALLTNNYLRPQPAPDASPGGGTTASALDDVLSLFDVVLESAKVGVRKPDPRMYELALERLEVDAADCVFLDDLGVNLKPARAMGMTTIKVTDLDVALAELETAVGFSVR
jgi:putative hydrolase of the HAD superfamily